MNTGNCIHKRRKGDAAVKQKWNYLSVRLGIFIVTGAVLTMLLFIAGWLSAEGTPVFRALLGAIFLLMLSVFCLFWRFLYSPWRETERVKELFSRGYVFQDVFEIEHPVSAADQAACLKFLDLFNARELINVSKKQAEYLALQNQINPHFLYNTLEGIRSEALVAGMDSIAGMTEALATFFRYTISNLDSLVTLEDELANLENYYYIQQFRFGDKLELSIEYKHDEDTDEAEILQYRLPKLTLQPIVENSIYHGIERKIGKGHLKIRIYVNKERLNIRISDDGLGIGEEKLNELNSKLKSLSLDDVNPRQEKKGGIAILNVNNRIKLLFGEEYGIYVYSQINSGTDVEITLPAFSQKQEVVV